MGKYHETLFDEFTKSSMNVSVEFHSVLTLTLAVFREFFFN